MDPKLLRLWVAGSALVFSLGAYAGQLSFDNGATSCTIARTSPRGNDLLVSCSGGESCLVLGLAIHNASVQSSNGPAAIGFSEAQIREYLGDPSVDAVAYCDADGDAYSIGVN